MSDLISRQNAIDVFEILSDKMSDAGKTVMAQAVAVLKDLQSAEPERRWIPVTKALPEEEKDVLVTVHFDGHKCSTVDHLPPSDYVEIASHVDGVWSSLSDEYKVAWKKHHVVAWMPTPDPYRGNE